MVKKRVLMFALLFAIFYVLSLISAEVIIQQQPNSLYNFGDVASVGVKIAASQNINDFFSMVLICGGKESEIHKEYIGLKPGEEKSIDAQVPLSKGFILGTSCNVKSILGSVYVLSNEFTVSDKVYVNITDPKTDLKPGEGFVYSGRAIKENGKGVEGFVDLQILSNGSVIQEFSDTVHAGDFIINFTLPENTEAGTHAERFYVYEKDGQNVTNNGQAIITVNVAQVPTSLEIFFEDANKTISPSEELKVKAVLHDQTGESIPGNAIITIKDSTGKIISQFEVSNNEFINFPVKYNIAPAEWSVVAVSNEISVENRFTILEKEAVDKKLVNNTLILTNIGNVPFNKTVIIKIGGESVPLDVYLSVDESKKYVLTAPDGYHDVQIFGAGEALTGNAFLTGSAIGAKQYSSFSEIISHPLIWIFVILILGFVAFVIFKKGYPKSFIGMIGTKKVALGEMISLDEVQKGKIIKTQSPAEMVLSIKGEKQDVSLVALKFKNYESISKSAEGCQETFGKLAHLAEDNKAHLYENNGSFAFIFAPVKTRTFKNEKPALTLALQIKDILDHHNKLFKQKINYGISVNHGPVIARLENGILKFMATGNLMNMAKRIAGASHEEVLLSEEIKTRLAAEVKAEKKDFDGFSAYSIKEVRDRDPENKKFITNFVRKYEKENKK